MSNNHNHNNDDVYIKNEPMEETEWNVDPMETDTIVQSELQQPLSPEDASSNHGGDDESEDSELFSKSDQEDDNENPRHSNLACSNYNDWNNNIYQSSKLNELICEFKWEQALVRVNEQLTVKLEPNTSTSANANKDTNAPSEISEIGYVDENGNLPLHLALLVEKPPPVIFIKTLLKRDYPLETSKKRQKAEYSQLLPLHLACGPKREKNQPRCVTSGSLEERIILLILHSYPEAVWDNPQSVGTPLHIVMDHKPDLNVVRAMVDAARAIHPNNSPLLAQRGGENREAVLHVAVKNLVSDEVILFLISECPSATTLTTNEGLLPLHFAALWGCSEDVLEKILESHVVAVNKQSEKLSGHDTPLHLLFHTEDNYERWTTLPRDSTGADADADTSSTVMPPGQVVKRMLSKLYHHLDVIYKQGQEPKKKKQKRGQKRQVDAFLEVQKIVTKIKNSSGCTVYQQMNECQKKLHSMELGLSDDFNDIRAFLESIKGGTNVFL